MSFHPLLHFPHGSNGAKARLESRRLGLPLGLLRRWQGPKHWVYLLLSQVHQEEAGPVEQQLALAMKIRDADLAGITYCATMLVLAICFLSIFVVHPVGSLISDSRRLG